MPWITRDSPGLRRRLTVVGLVLIAAYIAVFQLIGVIQSRGWSTVATLRAVRDRGVLYLDDERIFLVNDRGSPLALSARSPHLGERLLYCRSAGSFVDDHGDAFDRLGHYAAGPAPRGMDRVEVRVTGDLVQVKPSETTAGPPRGSPPAQPPSGPICQSDDGFAEGPPGFVASS